MDGPNFKICEVKTLINWLSNSSTEILRKNKELQYCSSEDIKVYILFFTHCILLLELSLQIILKRVKVCLEQVRKNITVFLPHCITLLQLHDYCVCVCVCFCVYVEKENKDV